MTSETPNGAKFTAALVQMCSGRDPERNTAAAIELIGRAAALGAHYVQTPEVTNVMELDRSILFEAAAPEETNRALAAFRECAAQHGIWLHLGSLAVRHEPDRLANRSFVIAPSGDIVARYDKLHMFDVTLADGETYAESNNYAPGGNAVVVDTPWGGLGLSICFDLRFPYLFRALAQGGAKMIAIPAAFTRSTGEAHWHVLLRARAIETQSFVLAAAQTGKHEHGRRTFGHSLIVSPWGEILAEAGTEPGVISAEIDMNQVEEVRQRVPSLRPNVPFELVHCAEPPSGSA